MKIGDLKISKVQGKELSGGDKTAVSPVRFQSVLKASGEAFSSRYLHELFDEIDRQGKKLAKSVSINEIKYYKRLISEFLEAAISSSYSYEKDGYSERGGKVVHAIVKKINSEVEALMKRVIENDINFDILKKIDEIRGLLLDILM